MRQAKEVEAVVAGCWGRAPRDSSQMWVGGPTPNHARSGPPETGVKRVEAAFFDMEKKPGGSSKSKSGAPPPRAGRDLSKKT